MAGSRLDRSRFLRLALGSLAALFCVAVTDAATAQPARFTFAPPIAAGPQGGTVFPDVEVRFTGDGVVFDWQVDFVFDPTRVSATAAALNGASCAVGLGDRVRVLAPVRGAPFPAGLTASYCRIRFSALPGAPTAITPVTASGTTLCIDVDLAPVPCSASGGSLSIGPAPGTASIQYQPAPGATVTLAANGRATIAASFAPGGAGDAVQVTNCTISAAPLFAPVMITPEPLVFAGLGAAQNATIALGCTAPSAGGLGTLTCAESRNGEPSVTRTWPLVCPNTFIAPTVTFAPPKATAIDVRGFDVIGTPNEIAVAIVINSDGVGSGAAATSTVDQCNASVGFSATLPGGSLAASGANGASAALAVACVPTLVTQSGTLACRETRGVVERVVTWPVACPIGRPIAVFSGGFEGPLQSPR